MTVLEAMPLVRSIYKRHAAGCCLHVVLDDGNVRDGDVGWCVSTAQKKSHDDCKALGEALLSMSRTQRLKIYNSRKTP